ncbi:ASCH domain-containing protein [Streptomyces sp. KMM 9044]|uniref:ASCH domain-containing protein n=1 Tax=Streptomyces sp. KMM 9044 TaxID=2744474 RepID=UPI002F41F5D6
MEFPGERLALLDNDGRAVATIEITDVETTSFAKVTWGHAAAEGEGDASLEDWRAGHRRFWQREGTPVEDGTPLVCLTFRVVRAG